MPVFVSQALRGEDITGFRMSYYGPYGDNLSTFSLLKQIAQIPPNLLLARVNEKNTEEPTWRLRIRNFVAAC